MASVASAPEFADTDGETVNHELIRSIMREHRISGLPERRRHKPSGSNRDTTNGSTAPGHASPRPRSGRPPRIASYRWVAVMYDESPDFDE